jgi:serine/threonine-protein kinase
VAQPTRRLPSSGRGAAPASQPVDDGEPLPAPARSRLPLVLGGVAVLAVVVVGAALALRPGEATPTPVVAAPGKTPPVTPPPKPDPTPTPTPTLTPQPERVQLKLTSTPEGAEVFDGDTLIGTTPLNLGREKGKALRLIVKKPGFVDATRAVSPEGDLSLDFELAPVKKAAPTNPTTTTPKPPAKPDGLRDAPY